MAGATYLVAADPLGAHNMPRTHQGLSLIELLIVVAVVGILAGIAYPSYRDTVKRAARSEVVTLMPLVYALSPKRSTTASRAISATWPACTAPWRAMQAAPAATMLSICCTSAAYTAHRSGDSPAACAQASISARRRATTSGKPVLLKINMEAGHGGAARDDLGPNRLAFRCVHNDPPK